MGIYLKSQGPRTKNHILETDKDMLQEQNQVLKKNAGKMENVMKNWKNMVSINVYVGYLRICP